MRPEGKQPLESLYFEYPQFDYRPAPELTGADPAHDVVITGAGPVGLVVALELARYGVRSVVLDAKTTVNDGSRAICLARHSLESLDALSVAERFLRSALGWTSGRSYYRGKQVYALEMPHSDDERFLPMYNLQQQFIEQFLVEAAAASPLIDLRFGHKVVGAEHLTSTTFRSRIEVETPDGNYQLDARYCVAADGARSSVRQALGLRLHGEAYEARYVIADIHLQSSFPTERRAFFDASSNAGATLLVHKQPRDIWRVDWQLMDDESDEDALEEGALRRKIAAILDMLGESQTWELEWWSIYKAFTLCLDDYRDNGFLFVGDAAHLVPIFGVRGLNSGLADAGNVAWKIAWILNHGADDSLLDSYSPERRGATLEVFENAAKSTRFMSPPTRGYQLLRDATLSIALRHDFAKPFLNPRQATPYTYADSVLSTANDDEFAGAPAVGSQLANCRLSINEFLLDRMPPTFVLWVFVETTLPAWLLTGAVEPPPMTIEIRLICSTTEVLDLARVGAPCTQLLDTEGRAFRRYHARDGNALLTRPDRHITACWETPTWAAIAHAYHRACTASVNQPGQ